jgi:murein DD-endopeptidase MepM/ murein hydrolase activator NlpD
MLMRDYAAHVARVVALVASSSLLVTAAFGEDCNTFDITRTFKTAKIGDYRLLSATFSFNPTTLQIPNEGGTNVSKDVILPSLRLRIDASGIGSRILNRVRSMAAGVSEVSFGLNSVQAAFPEAIVKGSMTIAHSIWIPWVKCDWVYVTYVCYPSQKEITIEKSFDWHSNSRIEQVIGHPEVAQPAPGHPVVSRQSFAEVKNAQISSNGTVDTHISNDLERFFYDVVTWFAGAFEGKFDHWNLEHEMPNLEGSQRTPLDGRSSLYPKQQTLIYRDNSKLVGKEGYRGLWQVFVDTLEFDNSASGFTSSGGVVLDISYKQDNITFAKRLAENRDPADTSVIPDPFYRPIFCGGTSRSRARIEEYLDELVSRLDGESDNTAFSGNSSDLRRVSRALYGTTRAVKFLLSVGLVNRVGFDSYAGTLPSAEAIWSNYAVVLPWQNAEAYVRYFGGGRQAQRCIERLSLRRHGSTKILVPFDDLSPCAASPVSAEQEKILKGIDDQRTTAGETNAIAGNFFAPVKNSAFAGWYYCSVNSAICDGSDNLIWSQKISSYGSRGSTHNAIEIVEGGDYVSSTNLFAIADGKLWFAKSDTLDWGNALILPFELGADNYYAIYGNLPSSASQYDRTFVSKGDPLGSTGCSGSSDIGQAQCSSSCLWSGEYRTAEHLHFVMIKREGTAYVLVDPVVLLGLNVSDDGHEFDIRCESPLQPSGIQSLVRKPRTTEMRPRPSR